MGAMTGRDYTHFHANVTQDFITIAIDLLADMLLNSTFPEERLSRERKAILEEIQLHHDEPFSRLQERLRQQFWADHPLGHPIAGHTESVDQLTREDVIYFVGKAYTPDQFVVAAAGAVDHADFAEQVQDGFWRMLGSSDVPCRAGPEYRPTLSIDHAGCSQAYFSVAIPASPYTSDDRYEVHALNNLLGGGMSSRLHRTLREEHGMAYYVQSEYHAYRDAGLLCIEGVTVTRQTHFGH